MKLNRENELRIHRRSAGDVASTFAIAIQQILKRLCGAPDGLTSVEIAADLRKVPSLSRRSESEKGRLFNNSGGQKRTEIKRKKYYRFRADMPRFQQDKVILLGSALLCSKHFYRPS